MRLIHAGFENANDYPPIFKKYSSHDNTIVKHYCTCDIMSPTLIFPLGISSSMHCKIDLLCRIDNIMNNDSTGRHFNRMKDTDGITLVCVPNYHGYDVSVLLNKFSSIGFEIWRKSESEIIISPIDYCRISGVTKMGT